MADEEEDSGTKLIIPKHEADLDEIKAALGVYAAVPVGSWMSNDEYKSELKRILGDDQYASSYTKKAQVPAYYGFIEWENQSNRSKRRITSSGRDFMAAIASNNKDDIYRLLIESMENCTFGDYNFGAPNSHSLVNPPNVLLRAILRLGGINIREFALLMWRMSEEDVPYELALKEVMLLRVVKASVLLHPKSEKWTDPKPITSLKKWGFIDGSADGRLVIAPNIVANYKDRIEALPLYNHDLLEKLFAKWLATEGYGGSVENYPRSLRAISNSYPGVKNTSVFDGMYERLEAHAPALPLFMADTRAKFNEVYGKFARFMDRKGNPDSAEWDAAGYKECYDYALSPDCTDKGRLYNAFKAYMRFFSWWDVNRSLYGYKEETMFIGDLGPIQKIVYGAPGTGKSFGTDDKLKDEQGNQKAECYRTTFHPDSDYSTFVGAYKPTMDGEKIVYKFRPQAFMEAYVAAWKEEAKGGGGVERTDKVKKPYSGLNGAMVSAVNAFIADGGKGVEKTRKEIIAKAIELSGGEFGEQSFVPSDYCYNRVNGAMTLTRPALFEFLGDGRYKCLGPDDTSYNGDILWQEKYSDEEKKVGVCTNGVRKLISEEAGKPVVLVIEEINRGNCAQIFGDLFQLLDRDESGYSSYPIYADKDLAAWLAEDEQFGEGLEGIECPACIKVDDWKAILKGQKLALPPKMYIWATMNTSDQSLFPIDSAFKRRWDWQYVPITNHADKDYKIEVGSDQYDWWDFLAAINDRIWSATDSEDKKLGYFFVKAQEKSGKNLITTDRFVNKVIFYLWNDVFKNSDPEKAFKFKKPDGKEVLVTFQEFFNKDDGKIDEGVVKGFIEGLGVKTVAAKSAAPASQTASPSAGQSAAASAPTAPAANP